MFLLSEKECEELRRLYAAGLATQHQLAEMFRVSQTYVSEVIRGDSYDDCGGPIVRKERGRGIVVLDEDKVREIRRRYARGERCAVMARELRLSYACIRNAVVGRSWSHVQDPPPLRTTPNEPQSAE